MPSQVDTHPLEVGKNLTATPGAVVVGDPMFELLQYTPTISEVWKRPIVITPPQINKYHSLDSSPEHRNWGLAEYVEAVDKAVDAAGAITGSAEVSIMGACSGGITSCAYAAWTAARGERKISSITLAVCALDVDFPLRTDPGSPPRTDPCSKLARLA